MGKLGQKSGKTWEKKWENLVKKRGKLGQKIFFITHYSPYKNTRDPIGSNISNFGQKLIVFKIINEIGQMISNLIARTGPLILATKAVGPWIKVLVHLPQLPRSN